MNNLFSIGGSVIKNNEFGKEHISGTTWEVYLYILTSGEPVGVRDIWRALKLSSPSLAQYHVNKLLELKVISRTRNGRYSAKEKQRIEALRSFVLLRGKLIPRLVFYGALVSGVLATYLILWPLEWNFRDLVVVTVCIFSVFAFFFEAYNQYRGLKRGVQKV